MIEFKCPACKKHYRVADNLAGKKGKCKDCGQLMRIPNLAVEIPEVAVEVVDPAVDVLGPAVECARRSSARRSSACREQTEGERSIAGIHAQFTLRDQPASRFFAGQNRFTGGEKSVCGTVGDGVDDAFGALASRLQGRTRKDSRPDARG